MRKWYRVGALAIGVTLAVGALAGCGAVGNSGTTNGGTVCIGTDFPVSGTDATSGTPAQNGAVLAADQAATLHGNYKLQVKTFDDAVNGVHNATQGATNVTKMVSDPCILAMVGPFNSGVAGAEIPIATAAGLAMISPANTNPGLTLQQYAQKYGFTWTAMHPSGKPEAYFRLPANDVVQGQEDAAIATQANYTKAYVVDDSESYGQGLADFFTQFFTQGGTGTVLGRDAINGSNTAQLTALVDKMKATNPQVVFYGGVTANGGAALRLAMSTNGMSAVPMVGGDGIAGDPGFIQIAGQSANGTTGTVAAPDISGLTGNPAAQKFQTDYQNKFSTAPITYSVVSYDAANIEIAAINSVIDSGKAPTRANVLAAIANTNYNGIIGNIRFDQNGDNSGQKVFSIYTVQNGQWVFVKQVPVQ